MDRIILVITIILSLCNKLSAQDQFSESDSLRIETLSAGFERYYTNPNFYAKNLPLALNIIDKNLRSGKRSNYFEIRRVNILDRIAFYIKNDRKYNEALEILFKNVTEKERLKEYKTLPYTYIFIGNILKVKKNYSKASEYFTLALVKAKEFNDLEGEIEALANQSDLLMVDKKYEDAKAKLDIALELVTKISYPKGLSRVYTGFLRLYRKQKDFSKALYYSKKSISVYEAMSLKHNLNDSIGLSVAYYDLGIAYRHSKKPQLAIESYSKSINYIKWNPKSSIMKSRYLGLSNSYIDLKDYKNGYSYYIKYKNLDKELDRINKYRRTIELESAFKINKQKAIDSLKYIQNIKLREQVLKRNKNNQIWFITFVFLCLVSVLFVLYYKRKQKITNSLLKNERLESELKSQEKDLTEFAVNISHHKKWSRELLNHIESLKVRKDKSSEELLNDIEKEVRNKFVYDDIANQFYNRINELGNSFYNKLNEKFPDLTKNEIHLCSLIKMKLSTSEISQLQNISTASVNSSRYRLRKKMKLSSEVNLDEYIHNNF